MTIQNNAIFLADIHFNHNRKQILSLLKKIQNKQIQISQLFLMGDIFDFLCGEVQYFQDINQELIDILNEISSHTETFYFEGNHDYNLQSIFPHMKVFQRKEQPQLSTLNNKKIALAHGDIFTPFGYELYTSIIRNSFLLHFLEWINFNNWLAKIIVKKLAKKKICNAMLGFDNFMNKRQVSYNCDLVIEGHFHQGYLGEKYINLPSFACDSKYMIYTENQFKFIKV